MEMTRVLTCDHPTIQRAIAGIIDDFADSPDLIDPDRMPDHEIWEVACASGVDLMAVCVVLRRFYSLVFGLKGLDQHWHLRKVAHDMCSHADDCVIKAGLSCVQSLSRVARSSVVTIHSKAADTNALA